MLKETYLAIMKKMKKKHPNATFIVVTATAKSVLAPSWDLVNDKNTIKWKEYEKAYTKHVMGNPKALKEMKRIKKVAKTKDVFLVCYEKSQPCHRFVLMNLINELKT